MRGENLLRAWIQIPKNRWPKHWRGRYTDPVIPLVLAFYERPDSGGFWERRCEECWPSIFWHSELRLLLAVYVDDFKLAGPQENHEKGWELIGKHIDMDTPEEVGRYLGCDHVVTKDLPVDVRPFAHVFDHWIRDPASTPAASARLNTGQLDTLSRAWHVHSSSRPAKEAVRTQACEPIGL